MIGRNLELRQLRDAQNSDHSEFVAVYGRRRVGKTFLINETFNYQFAFHASGTENAGRREQLDLFRNSLRRQGRSGCPRLDSWVEAFYELEMLIEKLPPGKKAIFLDELPWFDTRRSGFLPAFENFWNEWATSRRDILLIICGSATTWIIDKVLRNRGGLYNRITRRIPLAPFTLRECEQYAEYKHLGFDRRQILEVYMTFGGVAYYWSLLQEGQSAAQNLDRLFFGRNGELRDEFRSLFSSMFRLSDLHLKIVNQIGHISGGTTRDELLKVFGKTIAGGDLSAALEELVQCGFLNGYNEIGKKKKGIVYRLIDPYVIFYYKFIEGYSGNDDHFWSRNYDSPMLNSWRGIAFERVCMAHVPEIKSALGISGIGSDVFSWRYPADAEEDGVQIDMLIDRKDGVVNVCEIKYSDDEYDIDKEEDRKIRHRCDVFRRKSGIAKAVQPVMIAASGVKEGKYRGNISRCVSGDDLFAAVLT